MSAAAPGLVAAHDLRSRMRWTQGARRRSALCRVGAAIAAGMLALAYANVGAAGSGERRVDLWLSPAPADGDLRDCAVDLAGRPWYRARAGAVLVGTGHGSRLQQLGSDADHGLAWTQRCFQLRDGERVLVRGAVVPAESARWLMPPLWVLVLENRARPVPEMRMGCGFPAREVGPGGCDAWPAAGDGDR